jgi:Mg2+ and Co2+ transporter CorA
MSEIPKEDRKFCSVSCEFYKDSQSSGALGHVNRNVFEVDQDVLPEHLIEYPNFSDLGEGDPDPLYEVNNYNKLKEQAEEHKGKKFRKDATMFADGVVVLSQAQVDKNIQEKGYEWFRKATTQCIKEWQEDVKEKYKIHPMGFNFHMDEGHAKENKDNELEISSRNYHGHAKFFNFDFETGKANWRTLNKKNFSDMQTMLAIRFEKMGFERGISKEITKRNHFKKSEFIDQKQDALNQELENERDKLIKLEEESIRASIENDNLKNYLVDIKKELVEAKKELKTIKDQIKGYYKDLKKYITFFIKKEKKANLTASEKVLERVIKEDKYQDNMIAIAEIVDEEIGGELLLKGAKKIKIKI